MKNLSTFENFVNENNELNESMGSSTEEFLDALSILGDLTSSIETSGLDKRDKKEFEKCVNILNKIYDKALKLDESY